MRFIAHGICGVYPSEKLKGKEIAVVVRVFPGLGVGSAVALPVKGFEGLLQRQECAHQSCGAHRVSLE